MDPLDQVATDAKEIERPAAAPQQPGAPEGEQPGPAAEPQQDAAQMWAMIPAGLGKVLVPAMPELAAVYSDQNCLAWGSLAEKYAERKGWNVGEKAPGVMLLFSSLSMLIATVVAIAKRLIEARRRRAAAAAQPRTVTGVDGPAAAASAATPAGGGTGTGPNA